MSKAVPAMQRDAGVKLDSGEPEDCLRKGLKDETLGPFPVSRGPGHR